MLFVTDSFLEDMALVLCVAAVAAQLSQCDRLTVAVERRFSQAIHA